MFKKRLEKKIEFNSIIVPKDMDSKEAIAFLKEVIKPGMTFNNGELIGSKGMKDFTITKINSFQSSGIYEKSIMISCKMKDGDSIVETNGRMTIYRDGKLATLIT